jgi:trigger factor
MLEINEIEYCKINVQYEADNDTIAKKKAEVISKFKGQKVPGYRNGHATTEAIKHHYRKEINETLKQELAEEAVYTALSEKDLKPFGRPVFSYANLEESYIVSSNGESALPKFRCEFSLHVQPTFELGIYKDFEIPKPAVNITTEELTQRMLQDLRMKYGQTNPFEEEDFVQMGDTVILDYKTTIDGNLVEELCNTGDILNVGRINIPGFSESMLGMKLGETREFDLNMPEDHKVYANKTLHLEVKLTMGSKITPAALDDELAKNIGIETFDKLMDNVRSMASGRVKELEDNQLMDQISKRLIANHDFKIPSWVSVAEAQINARNNKLDWNNISDEEKEKYIDMSDKSIKLSLILQKVRDLEPDAQLTDEEIYNIAKQNLSRFSPEPDKIIEEMFKNGHLAILFNRIKDENTIKFIEKNCKMVE